MPKAPYMQLSAWSSPIRLCKIKKVKTTQKNQTHTSLVFYNRDKFPIRGDWKYKEEHGASILGEEDRSRMQSVS